MESSFGCGLRLTLIQLSGKTGNKVAAVDC